MRLANTYLNKNIFLGTALIFLSLLVYLTVNAAEVGPCGVNGEECPTAQTGGATTIFPAPTQTPPTGKTGTQVISLPNPLGAVKTIPQLIGRIVDWLILIASIAVLPFMIIWGAYQMLTAGGNPEAVTKARHTITWAVVGYGLLLISKGIEFIIRDILTRSA